MTRMNDLFVVTDFDAIGDGKTLCTRALQAAIDAAAVAGGTVVVPPGVFLTGTIFLKSRVTLELRRGAKILGSPNLSDYVEVRWGHHMDRTPYHLVMADGVEDVAITGDGEIDGNGPGFWDKKRPSEWHFFHTTWRRVSPMVEISGCKNVRVEGVRLTNSAGWTLHLHDVQHAWVRGVRIINTLFGPNTDGIDITGGRYITVSDCHITTGDDAIALKTSVDSQSCEYVSVTNCVLETNCVAVRVGYESKQDFRHIAVSNCVIPRCSRAIDLRTIDGCTIEHVCMTNITGTTNCGWPFNRPVEMYADRLENIFTFEPMHPNYGKYPWAKRAGIIRNITLSNLDFVTDGRVLIGAANEGEISDITVDNLRLRYAMIDDPYPSGAKAMSASFFRGVPDLRVARAAVCVENATNITMRGLEIHWPQYPVDEDWRLLKSPHRQGLTDAYKGRDGDIRDGKIAPPFHALWAKNLRGGRVDLVNAPASQAGLSKTELIDSDVELVGDK
jgi:hypothetical protein